MKTIMPSVNSNSFACSFLIGSLLFISLPFALEINNENLSGRFATCGDSWAWNLTQFPGNQNDGKHAVIGYIFLTVFMQ